MVTDVCSGYGRIIFMPGHAGVSGNDRADRPAGVATARIARSMGRADVLSAIRETGRVKDESSYCGVGTD